MERKSLFLAWILNVVPGVGLIYVGKKWPGIFVIMIAGVFLTLCMTGIGAIVGLPLYFMTAIIACISSAVLASKYNKALGR